MRGTRWMTLLILVPISQAVGCAAGLIRADADFYTTADFDGVKRVAVETRNGAIEVQCVADRSDVDIQAKRYATGLTVGDAVAHAEMIDIEAVRDPGQPDLLRIVAVFPPREPGRNYGAAFTIALPPDVSLTLHTKNGRVRADGANGDVSIETTNGRIHVQDVQGRVDARSSNGRLVLRDVAGDVELKTTNGSIELERVGSERIKAETTNGHIRAIDTRGEANVRSTNGSIELRMTAVPQTPKIRAVTSNGKINVACPAAISAKLRMRTSNGRVHADLKGVTIEDFESSRRLLLATINDGTGSIDIESSNGSITFQTIAAAPQLRMRTSNGRDHRGS